MVSPKPMKIDFVSDVSCPWCIIGLCGLEEALARTGDLIAPDITFQPFELNPHMGKDGQNIGEHVAEKYGSSPEQSQANRAMIRDRAADLGFTIAMSDSSRIYNTFDADRLLHWAQLEGKQAALKHALFNAYFTDQRDPSDHGVLIGASAKAWLDPARREEFVFWHSASGSSARFCPIPFNPKPGRLRSPAGKRVCDAKNSIL